MSKEEIVERRLVTYYEIIKLGPKIEYFEDVHRINALKATFGQHIRFFKAPSMESDDFFPKLMEMMQGFEDLIALEVSPELSEKQIRDVIEHCPDTPIIQPQFVNGVFIRYVSFSYARLITSPVHLSRAPE